MLVPLAVIVLTVRAETFIVGKADVPPVYVFKPFFTAVCGPVENILYKFVEPEVIVPPLNVFADKPPVNMLVPLAVIVLTVRAETFIVGKADVPPVYVFKPFFTAVCGPVENILYKFVEPEVIVPPLNVFADKPPVNMLVPLAVIVLTVRAETFIVGKADVPPVYVFKPFFTAVCGPVENILYKFVEPEVIVPPLNVFADKPPVNMLVPLAVIVLTVRAETFIVGKADVPPVYVFKPFFTAVCGPVENILYKFVEPEVIVPPLNVFADKPPVNMLVPLAVIVLTVRAETFIVGKADVPPVYVFKPFFTAVCGPVENILYKFVEPEVIVPPLNVFADKPPVNMLVPLAVIVLTVRAETFIVGKADVPPVYVFKPFFTAVCGPVENILYKFVEPEVIVPPLNVFADKPPVNMLVPLAVIVLTVRAETFIVGKADVPPVYVFKPFFTAVCGPVENMLYKSVAPEVIVPPLNVFADKPPVNTLVPLAVIVLIVNAETFIVGKADVPPVYVFKPFFTAVCGPVENILYKSVAPEVIVPPLNVFADKPAVKLVLPVTVPPLMGK